ncbi:hypothetical protein C8F01DRAFT_1081647 [Mycena amicta]|nr:hypothetical protein C8F01DRAFT_1081647 [Mycena amicta]
MRPSVSSIAPLLSLTASAHALVGVQWSMSNVPDSGLSDITFPITIVAADHFHGYYFAQQFGFVGADDIGYTGIQPREDASDGSPVLHGVFSSFVANTTSTDANCTPGADGGEGVSCAVEWTGVYGRTYDFEVAHNAETNTWTGTVLDVVTGDRIHIGSYQLPAGAMGIQSTHVGFVEWYRWNDGAPSHDCSHLPFQRTVFGPPYSSQRLASGTISQPYIYGECAHEVYFSTVWKDEPLGWQVDSGFTGVSGLLETKRDFSPRNRFAPM